MVCKISGVLGGVPPDQMHDGDECQPKCVSGKVPVKSAGTLGLGNFCWAEGTDKKEVSVAWQRKLWH